MENIFKFFNSVDDVMYYPILIIVLAAAGLYFTVRTRFVQLRLLGTACKLIVEKPSGKQHVSSFQALMVSTASRVGYMSRRSGRMLLDVAHVYYRSILRIYGEYTRPDIQTKG